MLTKRNLKVSYSGRELIDLQLVIILSTMAIGKLHNFFQASPVKPLGNVVRNSPIRMKPKPIGFEFAEIDARKILKPSSHDKYIHEPEFDSVVYISRFAEAIFRLLSQYFFRLLRLKWDPGIFKVFVHYLSKLLGPLGYLAPIFCKCLAAPWTSRLPIFCNVGLLRCHNGPHSFAPQSTKL